MIKKFKKKHPKLYLLVLLFVLALYFFVYLRPEPDRSASTEILIPEGSYLRIDYVDVGQADFIVVECDGEYMTIDGGNVEDRGIVTACLAARGITEIDTVVVTHAHEDHCGGVSAILDNAEVETL